MAEITVPIAQLLVNYQVNLPSFPPARPAWAHVHAYWQSFYAAFAQAVAKRAVPPDVQVKVIDAAQKTLWAFARQGTLAADGTGPSLQLNRAQTQEALKFPRPETVFALLGDLGAQAQSLEGGAWMPAAKLKTAEALRLSFPADPLLAASFSTLAADIVARTGKPAPAYERFLRADPCAILSLEKPPLDLPPDSPKILANLSPAAAGAWGGLVEALRSYATYAPWVEFRSIQYGLWVVNYNSRRGKRDLCGLIAQNGEIQVRVILYEQTHFQVQSALAEYSLPIQTAFQSAHWYEEYRHQWLFIPLQSPEEIPSIRRLLDVVAVKQ